MFLITPTLSVFVSWLFQPACTKVELPVCMCRCFEVAWSQNASLGLVQVLGYSLLFRQTGKVLHTHMQCNWTDMIVPLSTKHCQARRALIIVQKRNS